jgi:hypothetical protein
MAGMQPTQTPEPPRHRAEVGAAGTYCRLQCDVNHFRRKPGRRVAAHGKRVVLWSGGLPATVRDSSSSIGQGRTLRPTRYAAGTQADGPVLRRRLVGCVVWGYNAWPRSCGDARGHPPVRAVGARDGSASGRVPYTAWRRSVACAYELERRRRRRTRSPPPGPADGGRHGTPTPGHSPTRRQPIPFDTR